MIRVRPGGKPRLFVFSFECTNDKPYIFQELANTKACTKKDLQEATNKTQSIEKELKRVREQSQQQLNEVHRDNEKLIKDVKALQEHEDIEVIEILSGDARKQVFGVSAQV